MKIKGFNVYKIYIREREIRVKIDSKIYSMRKEGDPYIRRSFREQLEFFLNEFEPLKNKKEEFVNLIYKGADGLGSEIIVFVTKTIKK